MMENVQSSERRLEGIGGWLALMAIGQVLSPVQILVSMIQEYSSLPDGIFARMPLAFMGDVALRLSFLAFLIYTAYLFFNKRRQFPTMYISSVVFALALPFVVGIWVTVTSGTNTLANVASLDFMTSYIPAAVVMAIWVSYVLNSVRVRNTFIY